MLCWRSALLKLPASRPFSTPFNCETVSQIPNALNINYFLGIRVHSSCARKPYRKLFIAVKIDVKTQNDPRPTSPFCRPKSDLRPLTSDLCLPSYSSLFNRGIPLPNFRAPRSEVTPDQQRSCRVVPSRGGRGSTPALQT